MSNETFQEIELPEDLACELPTKYMAISAAGKSICVKHFDQNKHTMWVMREYRVVESWAKQVSIDVHGTPNFRVLQVLGCRKNNGEFLLERYDHGRKIGEFVSHNPKNNTNECLGIHTDPGYSCIVSYTESLVLLNKTS
ncbi:PREDICTED: F-box/kelch-repeat [Prunus dulcis]|uniref:PREDICTED: F-box/kelch-repeat n=1 Tax=Prunus dulcis TaxID=3755 RepID=A0A5E4GHS9_PRUDU|nr:PREDICTED: F-box/kelch-repeat [Prunus dulcis]VVA40854.1 PREDICTED: F-box/kelch-repeat [Prunus dulcis]